MMEDARTVEAELVEVWVDDPDVLTVDAVVVDEAEDARHMTAEEALAQAAREGLVLVRSRSNKTGYFGVQFDNRARQLKRHVRTLPTSRAYHPSTRRYVPHVSGLLPQRSRLRSCTHAARATEQSGS